METLLETWGDESINAELSNKRMGNICECMGAKGYLSNADRCRANIFLLYNNAHNRLHLIEGLDARRMKRQLLINALTLLTLPLTHNQPSRTCGHIVRDDPVPAAASPNQAMNSSAFEMDDSFPSGKLTVGYA